MPNNPESVNVLQECVDLQLRKSRDYQNPNSSIVQAMHYRKGIDTLHDVMHTKMLRAQSLLESGSDPNFESLEDTYKDLINYASFAVSWLRGKMNGQDPNRDIFNRVKPATSNYRYDDTVDSEKQNYQDAITVAALATGRDPADADVRSYVDGKLKQ